MSEQMDQATNNLDAGSSTSPAAAPASAPDSSPPEIEHNPERDPADWVTGGEPSTGPQESYIRTLAKEAGEDVPTGLTKAEASETIDQLQEQTGRG